MHKWEGGGIFRSLRKHVAWEVAQHKKNNHALREQWYPLKLRLLKKLIGDNALFKRITKYVLLIFLFVILDILITKFCPEFFSRWGETSLYYEKINRAFKSSIPIFLTVQAALIGLVFPVAIGLVTLLVQREGAGSTNSDIQVYYHEALAYPVAISSIGLIIALGLQIILPPLFDAFLMKNQSLNLIFKATFIFIHLFWLILNCVGLWHFLKTSLDFIKPKSRAILRKQFAANNVIPIEIFKKYQRALYMSAPKLLFKEEGSNDEEKYTIFMEGFGSSLPSIHEVSIFISKPSILYDVRMTLLAWVLRGWTGRLDKTDDQTLGKPCLIFHTEIGCEVSGQIILCSRIEGTSLKFWEKWLIKRCFVFKRVYR